MDILLSVFNGGWSFTWAYPQKDGHFFGVPRKDGHSCKHAQGRMVILVDVPIKNMVIPLGVAKRG
jgi:hypothetical protein